jgi:hypothetical protein
MENIGRKGERWGGYSVRLAWVHELSPFGLGFMSVKWLGISTLRLGRLLITMTRPVRNFGGAD